MAMGVGSGVGNWMLQRVRRALPHASPQRAFEALLAMRCLRGAGLCRLAPRRDCEAGLSRTTRRKSAAATSHPCIGHAYDEDLLRMKSPSETEKRNWDRARIHNAPQCTLARNFEVGGRPSCPAAPGRAHPGGGTAAQSTAHPGPAPCHARSCPAIGLVAGAAARREIPGASRRCRVPRAIARGDNVRRWRHRPAAESAMHADPAAGYAQSRPATRFGDGANPP